MPCIKRVALLSGLVLGGCSSPMPTMYPSGSAPAPAPTSPVAPVTVLSAPPPAMPAPPSPPSDAISAGSAEPLRPPPTPNAAAKPTPAPLATSSAAAAARAAANAPRVVLPAPTTPRNPEELKLQAARRLVQANPGMSYTGRVPDPLLAIPVLEVELNADGSVKKIDVMRRPTQAQDTIQLAIDAVHRAAPFGNVSKLPRPWRFVEVFLFDDERRFKPRTLDQ